MMIEHVQMVTIVEKVSSNSIDFSYHTIRHPRSTWIKSRKVSFSSNYVVYLYLV